VNLCSFTKFANVSPIKASLYMEFPDMLVSLHNLINTFVTFTDQIEAMNKNASEL